MKILICDIILIAFLAASLASDLRFKIIPNSLNISAIVAGMALNVYFSGYSGLSASASGAALGAGLLLIPYIMGGIGGGDLKMLAAVGAFNGSAFVFVAFIGAALSGGLIALFIAVSRGSGRETLSRIKMIFTLLAHRINPSELYNKEQDAKRVFPYAGAIAAGTLTALLFSRFFSL
ncbi:MAG: A24 family peptidase [bacterium]